MEASIRLLQAWNWSNAIQKNNYSRDFEFEQIWK